jgi:hypothetical protein
MNREVELSPREGVTLKAPVEDALEMIKPKLAQDLNQAHREKWYDRLVNSTYVNKYKEG